MSALQHTETQAYLLSSYKDAWYTHESSRRHKVCALVCMCGWVCIEEVHSELDTHTHTMVPWLPQWDGCINTAHSWCVSSPPFAVQTQTLTAGSQTPLPESIKSLNRIHLAGEVSGSGDRRKRGHATGFEIRRWIRGVPDEIFLNTSKSLKTTHRPVQHTHISKNER